MQAGKDLYRTIVVAGNGTVVAIANGANRTDPAIVDDRLIQLMRQRKALHAEQQQQQRNAQAISPRVCCTNHGFIVPKLPA